MKLPRATRHVALVQVYDTHEDKWFQATEFPGSPVFGHAGGIAGRKFVIAHGVAVIADENGKRRFGGMKDVWQGEIDPEDPARITWAALPNYRQDSRYRMAAVGVEAEGRVIFAGGADNPYNYDGIGYDKVPAKPFKDVFAYDFAEEKWITLVTMAEGTMDHRGLLIAPDGYYTVGGMNSERDVIGDVRRVFVREAVE